MITTLYNQPIDLTRLDEHVYDEHLVPVPVPGQFWYPFSPLIGTGTGTLVNLPENTSTVTYRLFSVRTQLFLHAKGDREGFWPSNL
ncbi:hypothetical protein HanIR_Chr15g0734261 [Helianthus annuus]|nr:hypothetical protein HanIR_Chr15g0734261 [Helianthus annuus]